MLHYDRMDVFEGIEVHQKRVIFVTNDISWIIALYF